MNPKIFIRSFSKGNDSQIVNDSNDWAREHDDPKYILNLLKSISAGGRGGIMNDETYGTAFAERTHFESVRTAQPDTSVANVVNSFQKTG